MEEFNMLEQKFVRVEKGNKSFEVGSYGTIRILNSNGEVVKEKYHPGEFSFSGGHNDDDYLMTHGYYAHRLVAEAFIGEIPKGYVVNHINGIKHDNRIDNLEIITEKENSI